MKQILLTRGKIAIVDDDIYELVKDYRWWFGCGYAQSYMSSYTGMKKGVVSPRVFLHHMVIGTPLKSFVVDHINHDKLDNRRENLRIVTPLQNSRNLKVSKKNKTGIRGVYWDKQRDKWTAQIKIMYKSTSLGRFNTLEEAIKARKKAEVTYGY